MSIYYQVMNKNLPKLVKYIFPSDEQRTGIWSAGYRDLHWPFARIDSVNIADLVKITCIIFARFTQPATMTYKSAASDEYILRVRKET